MHMGLLLLNIWWEQMLVGFHSRLGLSPRDFLRRRTFGWSGCIHYIALEIGPRAIYLVVTIDNQNEHIYKQRNVIPSLDCSDQPCDVQVVQPAAPASSAYTDTDLHQPA
jgi:hypothetical protein